MTDRDVVDDDSPSEDAERQHAVPGFGPPAEGAVPITSEEEESPPRTVRNVVLVLGAVVLVAIIGLVVAALVIISAIRNAVDDVESGRDETSITSGEYQSIELGTREETLREKFGDPAEESAPGDAEGEGADHVRADATCIYYYERDAGLVAGDRYRFCFVAGRLTSKSRN